MAEEADYYAVLDVTSDADELTIHMAYRRLARLYHPDVAGEAGAARMKQLNVAYQALRDAEQRRLYDLEHGIRSGVPRTPAESSSPPDSAPPSAAPPRPARHPSARPASPRRGVAQASDGPLRVLATLEAPDVTPVVALAFAAAGLVAGLGLLDGRILLHDLRAGQSRPLNSFPPQSVGALQELRLSPSGAYAATWGFPLGTHIFRTADGTTLWRSAMDAPGGLMDAALLEAPGVPPLVRLAVPDAPFALAADDPFRWADDGKFGTAVYTRALIGSISPASALPVQIGEPETDGGFFAPAGQPRRRWRVRHRALSADGQRLFTVAGGGELRGERALALSLYDLHARSPLSAPSPKRVARIVEPEAALAFPFATTADLAWVAASDFPAGLILFSLRDRTRRALPVGAIRPDAELALSPSADRIAMARQARLELWSVREAKRLQTWTLGADVTSLAFAPFARDQQLLGIGLANGLAVLVG